MTAERIPGYAKWYDGTTGYSWVVERALLLKSPLPASLAPLKEQAYAAQGFESGRAGTFFRNSSSRFSCSLCTFLRVKCPAQARLWQEGTRSTHTDETGQPRCKGRPRHGTQEATVSILWQLETNAPARRRSWAHSLARACTRATGTRNRRTHTHARSHAQTGGVGVCPLKGIVAFEVRLDSNRGEVVVRFVGGFLLLDLLRSARHGQTRALRQESGISEAVPHDSMPKGSVHSCAAS